MNFIARLSPPKEHRVSFIILEDHPLLLSALATQIRGLYPDDQIAYEGKDVIAAAEFCDSNTVAIVDLDLGDNRSAAEVVAIIAAKGARILVVSALGQAETIQSVMISGAHGYMSKRANDAQFKDGRSPCRAPAPCPRRACRPLPSRPPGSGRRSAR